MFEAEGNKNNHETPFKHTSVYTMNNELLFTHDATVPQKDTQFKTLTRNIFTPCIR